MGKLDDPAEATREAYAVGENIDSNSVALVRVAAEKFLDNMATLGFVITDLSRNLVEMLKRVNIKEA